MKWLWGPATRRLIEHYKIPWVVERAILDLGSSPGDSVWRGDLLAIEEDCPRMWVVHEVAHFIVTKRDEPSFLDLRNWGTEQDGDLLDRADSLEVLACVVNVALLIRMKLPWRDCAFQLNLLEDYWEGPLRYDYRYGFRSRFVGQNHWNKVREHILRDAQPYLDGSPWS